MELSARHEEYWRRNLKITALLLAIWFVATFVVAWFALTARRVETIAISPDERPDTPAERFYGPHPIGPAGPDSWIVLEHVEE